MLSEAELTTLLCVAGLGMKHPILAVVMGSVGLGLVIGARYQKYQDDLNRKNAAIKKQEELKEQEEIKKQIREETKKELQEEREKLQRQLQEQEELAEALMSEDEKVIRQLKQDLVAMELKSEELKESADLFQPLIQLLQKKSLDESDITNMINTLIYWYQINPNFYKNPFCDEKMLELITNADGSISEKEYRGRLIAAAIGKASEESKLYFNQSFLTKDDSNQDFLNLTKCQQEKKINVSYLELPSVEEDEKREEYSTLKISKKGL